MGYTITRVNDLGVPDADWNRPVWSSAETLEVSLFPWKDSGHRPVTKARLLYTGTHLGVLFLVSDRYVRAVTDTYQGPVCCDSCVEFFVAPVPRSNVYFNFEMNCGGTMLLYRNRPADERETGEARTPVIEEQSRAITVAHSLPEIVDPEITEPTIWSVEYHIPLALFDSFFESVQYQPGAVWRANFYKCGDHTSHPHWGSWAPVATEKPNFHFPDSFQEIRFGA